MFIIALPFMYPIFSSILINFEIIKDTQELEQYIEIFKSYNWLIIIGMLILFLYEMDINIPGAISKFISDFDFSYKNGESEFQFTHTNQKYKEEGMKLAESAKKEAKELLFSENEVVQNNKNCQECDREELIAERESLRYFSAYQVTNKCSRELLNAIYIKEKIEKEEFKMIMQEYYFKTIKNMGKSKKKAFSEKKINELLDNLKYLNIIEYTEDDKFIILTQNGKEFIKSQYSEEVG